MKDLLIKENNQQKLETQKIISRTFENILVRKQYLYRFIILIKYLVFE